MGDIDRITIIAKAIVQADERDGGPCWDLLMTMGKHVVSGVWGRADEVIAALDAAEARAVGEHDPECRLVERGQTCNCGAALPPASPLGAVVMREKAARIAEDRNDEIWDIYTGEKVGLDGCAEKIRAIPLPTDDELFAAAAELLAKNFASLSPEELGRFELAVEIDGAIAALAPFTRKGE